jgi:hypothetical protein
MRVLSLTARCAEHSFTGSSRPGEKPACCCDWASARWCADVATRPTGCLCWPPGYCGHSMFFRERWRSTLGAGGHLPSRLTANTQEFLKLVEIAARASLSTRRAPPIDLCPRARSRRCRASRFAAPRDLARAVARAPCWRGTFNAVQHDGRPWAERLVLAPVADAASFSAAVGVCSIAQELTFGVRGWHGAAPSRSITTRGARQRSTAAALSGVDPAIFRSVPRAACRSTHARASGARR